MNKASRPHAANVSSRALFGAKRVRGRHVPLALLATLTVGAAATAAVVTHGVASASVSSQAQCHFRSCPAASQTNLPAKPKASSLHAAPVKVAVSMHTVTPTECYDHPTFVACENQDPVASGCAADGRLVEGRASADVVRGDRVTVGRVDLMWSPHCQTNWARATSYVGKTHIRVEAVVSDWQANASFLPPIPTSIDWVGTGDGVDGAWSNMVFAGPMPAGADVAFGYSSGTKPVTYAHGYINQPGLDNGRHS